MKHAEASEVWFRFSFSVDEIIFSLEDNGRGFNPDHKTEFGKGLGNMRNRVRDAGGQLEIDSVPGRGTTLRLRLPAPGAINLLTSGGTLAEVAAKL